MTQEINYIVAKTSPGLYAAAKQAGLNTQQRNQIEQFSWTVDKNKQLSSKPIDLARSEFNNLDADIQEMLKFLYPNAEYTQGAPTTKDYAFGALKTARDIVASPIVGLFKVAGVWNRLINTPYLVARQTTQGEGFFNTKTFTDAWDGRRVYDNGALTEAIKVFGKEKVEVAKGLLAGLTPGEIISSYGSIDQKILDAISEAFSEEASFKQVLDGVKYAQVSPGRDLARSLTKTNNRAVSSPHLDYISGRTKNISGWVDFAYQLMVDPLSYVTAGFSKVPILGARLAGKYKAGQQITDSISRYGSDGVREAFKKYPELAKHWNDEIIEALYENWNKSAKRGWELLNTMAFDVLWKRKELNKDNLSQEKADQIKKKIISHYKVTAKTPKDLEKLNNEIFIKNECKRYTLYLFLQNKL